ncbi:TPA: hypothetical protein SAO52_005000 [Burkholderia vietnamiensis]|nr:hypothetical protein [Burkholderia vietnamiensis]
MKFASVAATLLISSSTMAVAQQPVRAAIYLEDRTEDVQGHRLAYAVKEQIRKSASMRLVDTVTESALQVHLASVDPDNTQIRTVYSVAFSLLNFNVPEMFPYYLDSTTGVCGSHVIDQCANSLVAILDNDLSALRAGLAATAKK